MFLTMSLVESILAQHPQNPLLGLRRVDRLWTAFRQETPSIPTVITSSPESLENPDFDLIICGGTLGIILATTLQQKGLKIAIIERGILQGREQEWNISHQELQVLLELNLLTEEELNTIIFTEYNPARIAFYQGYELWVKDVLNLGVSPYHLLGKLKEKFLQWGGQLWENNSFVSAVVHPQGVKVNLQQTSLTTRLLIDAMGHFSPIVKQARQGQKPDGVCLVVGSCGKGFKENETGDLIATFTPILNQCQYFWEAFPAKQGRTTYLFTYVDTHPQRFSLEFLMNEYFKYLPSYQNIELNSLNFIRFLFGFFPAYQNSPLHFPWNRIMAIGDSAGGQSPVSFGGFGAMLRHLQRLTNSVFLALKTDSLLVQDLQLIQSYQPNIALTWLFQKTMSVPFDKKVKNAQEINQLMSAVFQVMNNLGEDVLKPFLQDVIQFIPLSKTLPLVNPKYVFPLLPQVGVTALLDWIKHYINLGLFTGLSQLPLGNISQMTSHEDFITFCYRNQWRYGSGKDEN